MTPTKRLLTSAALAGAMFTGGVFGVANMDIGTAGAQDGEVPQVETQAPDQEQDDRRGDREAKFAGLADILGISGEDLASQLRDGATLAEVAEANGVATQTVIDYLVEQGQARIDAALEAGRITEEEAAEKSAGLVEKAEARVNGEFSKRGHGKRGHKGAKLETLSEVLGLEQDELRTELRSGATVADIAEEQGVSVDAVVDALVADMTERVEAAVEAGRMSEEEAAEKLEGAEDKATDFVNGEGERRERGRRGQRGGNANPEGTDTGAVFDA